MNMTHIQKLHEKLRAAGMPDALHAKIIEFEEKYHGREDHFGLNVVYWGVLFDAIRVSGSALIAGDVDVEEEEGLWHVVCADVHVSDTMTIDQFGRLYWSYQPRYSDFNLYFEGNPPDIAEE